MGTALEDLLARAVELEQKAAAGELDPDAIAALHSDVEDFVADEVKDAGGFDFADPELEAKGAAGCSCGATEVDEFADGSAVCDGCGAQLRAAGEVKAGFDFDELPDDVLLEEKRDYSRDGDGKFAHDNSNSSQDSADPNHKPEDEEKHRTLDQIRELMKSWGDVPPEKRAALKERLLSRAKELDAPDRMLELIGGLGDGDGKREAGEGAGAALADHHGNDWVEKQKAGKADPVLDEFELLRARRAALDV